MITQELNLFVLLLQKNLAPLDLDENAARRQAPGNTETDDASSNDSDLWFANTQNAVGQEWLPSLE